MLSLQRRAEDFILSKLHKRQFDFKNVSAPCSVPLASVVTIKIISANLSIFLWKMPYNDHTELCFFLQYLTEDPAIEATLLYNLFAKQFSFFLLISIQYNFT